MWIVPISDNIRIRYEALNYNLEQKTIVGEHRKTKAENIGAIRWDVVGYYGDLRSAAHGLLTRHSYLLLPEDTIMTLRALIDAIDQGADLIATACRTPPQQENT